MIPLAIRSTEIWTELDGCRGLKGSKDSSRPPACPPRQQRAISEATCRRIDKRRICQRRIELSVQLIDRDL